MEPGQEISEKGQKSVDQGHDLVDITVDGKEIKIHRGRRTVAEIKKAGEVPAADELSQIIDGKIIPLSNDASVVIKGAEVFVSNKPSGGSSWE